MTDATHAGGSARESLARYTGRVDLDEDGELVHSDRRRPFSEVAADEPPAGANDLC